MNAEPESNMRLQGHWFAWSMWVLTFSVALLTLLFVFLNWFTSFPALFCCAGVSAVLIVSFSVTSITVGALIASRRAGNPIGWIFGSASLLISLWLFAFHYAIYTGLTSPNSLPGGAIMAWMGQWLWLPGWGLIALLFLLFPNGHLPSRRWWLVAAFLTGSWVVTMICLAFLPGQLEWSVWVYKNPFGVDGVLGTALGKLLSVSYLLSYLSFLACALSLVYRFYKAVGIERQQIKWIAYAGAVFGLAFLFSVIFYGAEYWSEPGVGVLFLAVNGFPLAVGIAILKDRLYNIDLLINRTLVYGALTVSVVGLYALVVGGFGVLLQTQNSLPGIVIAIFLIAFLFQPLRRRLEEIANRFIPLPQSPRDSERTEDKVRVLDDAANTALLGRWLIVARVTWAIFALLAFGLFIVAVPSYAAEISDYIRAGQTTVASAWDIVLYVSGSVVSLLSTLSCLILAVIMIWRKPNERMAVYVSSYLLLLGMILGGSLERFVAGWPAWAVQVSASAKPLLFATPTVGLLALFPSGRFIPHWTGWLTLSSVLLIAAIFYLPPWWWPNIENPIAGVTAILWAAILLGSLYAQIYRYRKISNSTERQQTKWVVFGFFLWLLLVTLVSGPYSISYGSSPASPHPWWAPVVRAVWFLSSAILPVSLTIAVMRYRLFDIDLLINRSVVYLTMTAIVVGIYVVIVGYLGVLFQTGNNLAISLIATGLVAVMFQPLRQRLQRGINRLMYGERDDPYVALSRLGQRLEAAYAPESVLPTIVEAVAQTLKLPYVGIALNENREFKIAAEFGRSKPESISLPLNYQGEPVGALILAPRAPGEQFTSSERQLLEDLARQAGVAAHAVHLTADLQRSRERLVLAREEERRRLRRDLHDGLGPQLAGLALKLETLRNRLRDDPLADSLLADLAKRTQDATADIRHLVYELRPPTLDELGLVSALREGLSQYNQHEYNHLQITIDAPDHLPPLPAAVEVAAYRIAQEALMNVLRHADAHHCKVKLGFDEQMALLCLDIQDDGRGLSPTRRAGVGLSSMRERAEELGGTWMIESIPTGGTHISVRLPYRLPDEPASSTSKQE